MNMWPNKIVMKGFHRCCISNMFDCTEYDILCTENIADDEEEKEAELDHNDDGITQQDGDDLLVENIVNEDKYWKFKFLYNISVKNKYPHMRRIWVNKSTVQGKLRHVRFCRQLSSFELNSNGENSS